MDISIPFAFLTFLQTNFHQIYMQYSRQHLNIRMVWWGLFALYNKKMQFSKSVCDIQADIIMQVGRFGTTNIKAHTQTVINTFYLVLLFPVVFHLHSVLFTKIFIQCIIMIKLLLLHFLYTKIYVITKWNMFHVAVLNKILNKLLF